MTTTQQYASLGRKIEALVDEMVSEQVIFGRKCSFTPDELDAMLAREVRELVARNRGSNV